jgi:hypothetical protein
MPMHTRLKLAVGDVAAVAIHREEREAAEQVLVALGWTPEAATDSEPSSS